MRTSLVAATLAALAFLTVPGVARAECDVPPTMDAGLLSARTVFIGNVASVDDSGRTAAFDVQWVWKGVGVQERVVVQGAAADTGAFSPDDRQFQVGVTYLVASPSPTQPYLADRCTSTRAYQGIGSAIPQVYQDAVDATAGWAPDPVPVVEDEGSNLLAGPIVPIIFGGLLVGGLGVLLARITRGPAHSNARPTQTEEKPKRRRAGRAPKIGRTGDRFSGLFRRSGVGQAAKLRGIRRKKERRRKKSRNKGAESPREHTRV